LHTIAIANFKGGTGKTATCYALGTVLAKEHGWPVLLVDCDPQSSLTGACGVNDTEGKSLAEMFDGSFRTPLELELFMYHIIRKVKPNLDLVPADIALARSERRLAFDRNGPSVLREALRPLAFRYGVTLLDCPPNFGLLTTNALVAADAVLIPTIPHVVDLRALKLFLDTLKDFRTQLNPRLEILGILVTFFDGRLLHHQRIVEAMHGLDLPVLDVMVGRSIRVAEAASEGKSIVDYEPDNPQAEMYRQLGAIVDSWAAKRPIALS
jgi:chromosome partitioning protein